jgi:type IV pilus assembly protein PilB
MSAQPSAESSDTVRESRIGRSRLESLLIARCLVTMVRLAAVSGRGLGAKRPLVEVLLEQGVLDEDAFVRAVAAETRMEPLRTEDVSADPAVQRLIPSDVAQRHGLLPLRLEADGTLVIATADPFQIDVIDEVRARSGHRVRVVLAPPTAVRDGLRAARLGEETFDELLRNAEASSPAVEIGVAPAAEELEEAASLTLGVDVESDESPVVRFVNMLLADAIRQGASDVHIEPERDRTRIRFRIDGRLHEIRSLPRAVRAPLTSRVKIVSGLDIMESRRPQDGRATVRVDSRAYDLRVSTLPRFFGEKLVLRILDAQAPTFSLDASGIAPDDLARWRELSRRPSGMLLLTGPTGSGKTSTLYASLLELRDAATNIVAIEDPVEFQFPGIVHVPVRPAIGTTFAAALRSVLRQDPDVILVGEIRDRETAEIAVQASLTGHLMLSTLHTNDAVGALLRLANLGVERDMLASSVLGIMAQRSSAPSARTAPSPTRGPTTSSRCSARRRAWTRPGCAAARGAAGAAGPGCAAAPRSSSSCRRRRRCGR